MIATAHIPAVARRASGSAQAWLWLVGMVIGLAFAQPASAFGLRTHLWIGQDLINDLQRDCKANIAGVETAFTRDVCESIQAHPGHFLSGVLGPDIYPDLITGQVTAHPGIPGDWQTSDWLRHLYETAQPGPDLAFAAGYIVHAASDTFAHSYVNAYSGDVFMLSDERAVELRHFVLEKYIDYRLPAGQPSAAQLQVPAAHLRDQLIYNDNAARVSAKSGFSLHIPAMNEVRKGVGRLERKLDDLEEDAGRALASIIATHLELSAQLADGEAGLHAAEASLAVHEASLKAQKAVLDAAQRALNDALDALEKNQNLIQRYRLEEKLAREVIQTGRRELSNLNNLIADSQNRIVELQRKLATTPAKISEKVCGAAQQVCSHCPDWAPFCSVTCRWVTPACKIEQVVNQAYQDLVNGIGNLNGQINDAQRKIADWSIKIAANAATEIEAAKARAEQEALTEGFRVARDAAELAYKAEKLRFEHELAITEESRRSLAKLRGEIAALRKKVLDTESIKETIAELVASANLLSFHASNWRVGLDISGEEFIKTGLEVSRLMVNGEDGTFTAYKRWLQCFGSAYTPVPYQVGTFACKAESFLAKLEEEIDKLVLKLLPPPFDTLVIRMREIKADINGEINRQTEDAMLKLAKWAAPDKTTGEFIELLVRPENATAEKLVDVFDEVGDSGGKPLLVIPEIESMVNRDIAFSGGSLKPEAFAALGHARTLSRIALLDAANLRWLGWRLGADPQLLKLRPSTGRYSVLFQSLRSIDGNHQWQPFGLPYARSQGEPQPVAEGRQFGYGPMDGAEYGFPFYIDPTLRQMLFPQLFARPVSGALASRPELQNPRYAFPECAGNPFPLAMKPDGAPALADTTCLNANADVAVRAPLSTRLRRKWRAFLALFGAHRV